MQRHFLTYGIIACTLLISCSHGIEPSKFVHYVENPDNGLCLKQKINGVNYTLQYQPTDYCVMLEKRSFSISSGEYTDLHKRFSGLEHYLFRIERRSMDSLVNTIADTSRIKKRAVEYFYFGIQKDIKLVEGNDTIPCAICQADVNSGISQYYTFSIGFPNKAFEGDRCFEFGNKVIKTGDIKMAIEDKAIKNIPLVKMN